MFGAIAGGIASALAGGAMSKLFGGGQKAASGGIQGDVLATDNNTVGMGQMLRDFIGIRVNRAKKSGVVNITSSVNSRERSGINTILHELNPLFTINVTMRDIKSKNVYSRVNSKATTQRSEERFSRNAETDIVCRLLLEKKKKSNSCDNSPSNTVPYSINLY